MPKPNSDCRATERKHPWPMVRLGDVCEINLGKTPPRGNARFWDKGRRDGYKWLSIADLANTQGGSVFDSKEYISKAAVEEVGVPVVLAGTFLLSFKLTLGRTAIAGCDLYTNEAIAAMPVKPAFQGLVDLQFLNLYCRFFDWEDFAAKDEKVLGKTLNKKKLAEVPLPLPPLSVQREIVARLERELAAVEKIKKDFEALAETAKAEFEAERLEVHKELLNGEWSCAPLKKHVDVLAGYAFKSQWFVDSGIRICGGLIIAPDRIKWEECKYWKSSEGIEQYLLQENDLVIALDRPWISGGFKIGAIGRQDLPCLLIQRTARLRMKDVDFRYVMMLLRDESFKLHCTTSGTTVPHISHKDIETYEIPFPPAKVQKEIVARLSAAKTRAEKLEAKAREGVAACETIRKAILKEAFE